MRHPIQIAFVVVSLALSAPATAQHAYGPPGETPRSTRDRTNTLRLNLGTAFYSAGWYTCYYGSSTSCASVPFSSTIPFVVGPQVDLDIAGGMNAISLGFTVTIVTTTSSYFNMDFQQVEASTSVTVWEPTVDYVGRIGSPADDTSGRFRVGAAVYFGRDGQVGGGFRLGGGLSLLGTHRFGIGIDMVAEGGVFNGTLIGGLQILASPEFHF